MRLGRRSFAELGLGRTIALALPYTALVCWALWVALDRLFTYQGLLGRWGF